MKPEPIPNGLRQIREVEYRRLTGELKPDGVTRCDVIDCVALAICLINCGCAHPSCEEHALGADYISPLPAFWPEEVK